MMVSATILNCAVFVFKMGVFLSLIKIVTPMRSLLVFESVIFPETEVWAKKKPVVKREILRKIFF